MPKIHLDTDLGGDIDDLCALALLLCWPGGVELSGVTIVGEIQGRRTGYTHYVLAMTGHGEVPAAAGADIRGGYYPYELGLPSEERYWPEPVAPRPNPPEQALDLLESSIEQGALIVAIGPLTNLALLERRRPGILARANLVLMGGYVFPVRPGYPAWGNRDDFNVQVDVRSARLVFDSAQPTLVPLSVTVETALRRAHLPALRAAGPLGRLIARQAEEFAIDEQIGARLGPTCPALPADMINFQHDPLACAVALGWRDGVEIAEVPLCIGEEDGCLVERIDPAGRTFRVVRRVEGERFNQFWLDQVAQH